MDYDPQNIFAKILRGEIPCERVYEDADVLAFRDVAPQAPTHVLVIPKQELVCLAQVEDAALLGRLMAGVQATARELGLAEGGYRVVINNGAGAGQTVFHLHVHILAGRELTWPPG